MGCLVAASAGLDELATTTSYFFKYYWPDQVLVIGEAACSTTRIISSSSESVRESTSVSASLEEAYTTLQEDAFALSLDFLLVTVVHC